MSKKHCKPWLTPKELEEEYSISRAYQAKLRMNGEIPHSKIGTKIVRYSRQHIEKWLEDNDMGMF